MKKVLSILLSLAMFFGLVACNKSETSNPTDPAANDQVDVTDNNDTDAVETDAAKTDDIDVVKIGVILPITGSQAAIGNRQLAGMKLAVAMANENGGIKSLGGANVELVISDTTGDPQVGVTEAERLITSNDIAALLGPYSSAVGAATAPVAERYSMPYMLTNATADEILQNNYEYVFRANVCNGLDGVDLIKFVSEMNRDLDADIKNIAIVYENSDWGKGMSNGIMNEVEKNYPDEFSIVINESYEADNADFSAIINKIRNAGADLIIPMNYLNDALLFVQTLADYKVSIPVLAHSGGYTVPEFLQNAGSNADYVMTFSSWDASVLAYKPEEAAEINKRYKEEFSDGGVDMDTYSANGWLGAATLINAIDRAASTDGEAIRDALKNTDLSGDAYEVSLHPFEGIKFGETLGMTNQNVYSQSVILQIIDGEYKLIGPSVMTSLEDSEIVFPIPEWDER